MADAILEDNTISPTAAARRAGINSPADLRRFQRKWKQAAAELMAAARQRKAEKPARTFHRSISPGVSYGRTTTSFLDRIMEDMMWRQRLIDQMNPLDKPHSAAAEAMRRFEMSPVQEALRQAQEALQPAYGIRSRIEDHIQSAMDAQDEIRRLSKMMGDPR